MTVEQIKAQARIKTNELCNLLAELRRQSPCPTNSEGYKMNWEDSVDEFARELAQKILDAAEVYDSGGCSLCQS